MPGFLTCPERPTSLGPPFFSVPCSCHQSPPRSMIVGTQAIVSTLLTIVGHENSPTTAGNGGLRRGCPALPSIDSIMAVSSPQM